MTTSTAAKPTEPPSGEGSDAMPQLTHRQILTILGGLMSGMFLAALDQTIVSTAARTIADDLNSLSMQAWITTAYLITATISTPLYGKLSDIYGRKPFYIIAISIFLVGSVASAFAPSMGALAAFRAIQGAGAGGLMSLALTILGDVVSPRQRAKYQGYFLAVFGTATVVGPLAGGLFAGADTVAGVSGWRWVFLINVPLGALALFVVGRVLNVPHQRQNHRIDWWGALALITTLVPLLLVSQQGREWGWDSTGSLVCYGVGALGLLTFLLVESRMKDAALLPLRLFRNRTFSVSVGGGFIVGIAMFGAIMLIPQYLQIVQGYSPMESGLLMLPLMVGMMSATVFAGQLTSRTGRYKVFPVVGTAVMSAGMLLFTRVEWDSPLWQPMVYMAVIGLGLGNCMQTLMIAVQNAGPRRDMGVSTATATFVRQTGGTVGTAAFLSILFSTVTDNIREAFANAGVRPSTAMSGDGTNVMNDSSFLSSLPTEQARPFYIGFTESISTVFYVGAGVAALACLVLLFMKEIPLADSPSKDSPSKDTAPEDTATPGDDSGGDGAGGEEGLERMDVLTESEPGTELVTTSEPEPVGAGRHTRAAGNGHSEDAEQRLATAGGITPHAARDVVPGVETSVSGRVRRADGQDIELTGAVSLEGVARNDSDRVIADARITVLDTGGNVAAITRTDASGHYVVNDLPAGEYTVVASGYPPATSRVSLSGERANHDVRLGYEQGIDELTGR